MTAVASSAPPKTPSSAKVDRVGQYLAQQNHATQPQWLASAAPTAQTAADALGVALGQIAKSIVFRPVAVSESVDAPSITLLQMPLPVLVVASGDDRVDVERLQAWLTQHPMPLTSTEIDAGVDAKSVGAETNISTAATSADGLNTQPAYQWRSAEAAFVKQQTGYAVGGVCPLVLAQPTRVLIDERLKRFDTVWAAAGHPYAVFAASPEALRALAQAEWAPVCHPQ